jgi:phenylacetate-CoA ligase
MRKLNNEIFWLKNKLFRPKAIAKYRELTANQQLDEKSLAALNWKKRKAIVEHAYNNTAFYSDFYNSYGFHPSMLLKEGDWDKVPILEREMIRENIPKMTMKGVSYKRLKVSTTGGSTGHPLKVYHDKAFNFETLAWRLLNWWDVSPGDNGGTIHRAVPTTAKAKFKKWLTWIPTKRVYLDASSFNSNDIKKFIMQVKQKKVVRITGYVGAVEKIAEYVLLNNEKVNGIEHIWTTSAPLSSNARRKIEKAFSHKVMDQYGSCEVLYIAQQCPYCEGIHVNSDIVHVDIIDCDGISITDNSAGDILVTNMESFAFPLIKYRLGDRSNYLSSQYKKCSLPFPLMNFVAGRTSDMLSTPSGITLTGDYWTTIFDGHVDNILAFQVRQKKDNSITIRVVVNPDMTDNHTALEKVKKAIEEKVRYEVSVNIEITDKIEDNMGKTRYVIKE